MQAPGKELFSVTGNDFEKLALQVFHFQYNNNAVYRSYIEALGTDISRVTGITAIPFLPVQFFKTRKVMTTSFVPEVVFESSGTTGTINSRHYVKEAELYKMSFTRTFERFYGQAADYCVLGLLPSYIEKGNSSLVYMTDELIRSSGHSGSGFYLNDLAQLAARLTLLEASGQKTVLIGVTYALLDFAAQFPMRLNHTIIMETGGMKGKRKELIRAEVHRLLKYAFGVPSIHSEYGMTELLSQAYSKGGGVFHPPSWMRILLREEEDPLTVSDQQGRGVINIIDLANIYSCSFIATDDLGVLHADGAFEVLGRSDNSDIRGCSLLAL